MSTHLREAWGHLVSAKEVPAPTVDDIPPEVAAALLERYAADSLSLRFDEESSWEGNHGEWEVLVHRGNAKLVVGSFYDSAPRRNKRPIWALDITRGFNRNSWEYPE